jgi:aspartyl-tRNA(Asn)/glutamyl-tRNA(Gln) amidotransferase subunit A
MTTEREICETDAVALASRIRERELSPVEVVDAVLNRLERLNPTLNAFCTAVPELARADARRIERAIMAGEAIGPLAGVPVAIKDLVLTKGIRTVSGCWAYADFVPDEDDVVVERLQDAGAVVLGKTNVDELGYNGLGRNPVFGQTRNPWDVSRTPGGSSAGSAAAVASGIGPFAIGSDGGGSIRIPSSFCGLYGFKASFGRVPLYPGCRDERFPGVSGWESIEHIGPISRTAADAALMLSVIAGPDDRDRHSLPGGDLDWMASLTGGIAGLRVAYSPDWGWAAVDPEVRSIVDGAVTVFARDLGCDVEVANPGFADFAGTLEAIIMLDSDLTGMRALADELGERMTPSLRASLAYPWTAEEFTDAVRDRKAVVNTMATFMRRFDLLLTPTLAVPAFAAESDGPAEIAGRPVRPSGWTPFTGAMNLTGQPAATVPAGWTSAGLPVGLQIVGRHLDDATVLRASAAFEEAAPWAHRWPDLERLAPPAAPPIA